MMQEAEFVDYLKKTKRPAHTITRYLNAARNYESYLKASRSRVDIKESTAEDLRAYAEHLREKEPRKAYQIMWAIDVFFRSVEDNRLSRLADALKWHVHDRPLKLAEIQDVDKEHTGRLARVGIRDVRQMVQQAATPESRNALAMKAGVPVEAVLELAKLSDLSRIGGLKAVRVRLYYDAGLDTLEKIAEQEPMEMKAYLEDWVKENAFPGSAPTIEETTSAVDSAAFLDRMVEY